MWQVWRVCALNLTVFSDGQWLWESLGSFPKYSNPSPMNILSLLPQEWSIDLCMLNIVYISCLSKNCSLFSFTLLLDVCGVCCTFGLVGIPGQVTIWAQPRTMATRQLCTQTKGRKPSTWPNIACVVEHAVVAWSARHLRLRDDQFRYKKTSSLTLELVSLGNSQLRIQNEKYQSETKPSEK